FELNIQKNIFVTKKLNKYKFIKATQKDVEQIKNISKNLFIDSRYYFDLNFPRNKVKDFYQNWSEKAVYGQYDNFAYILKENFAILAFITIKLESKNIANISLIGVNYKFQNRGLGSLIVSKTINKLKKLGIKKIYVVTQGRNYYAQNLYQSNGFKTKSLQLWYHKWF
ncbi:GNAT family N-acetyltransferase, partial [Alphaproteobacteria bacterium]|nr:GNAT family N-acetyltransferase [Alphaproteobacteria bacterium]